MRKDTIPPQQYYISQNKPDRIPDGYKHVQREKWHIVFDDSFSIRRLVVNGTQLGTVIGTALDSRTTTDGDNITATYNGGSDLLEFETAIANLFGRWIALFEGHDYRLYTDVAGMLPAVYEPGRETIAASPAALPNINTDGRLRQPLIEAVTDTGSGWIPGTVTYHSGVKRLLPNHYLNLTDFEQTRYWPKSEIDTVSSSDEKILTILSTVADAFTTLNETYETLELALTAGKDSRALLAIAKSALAGEELRLYTLDRGWNDLDKHTARRIAEDHNLDWRAIPTIIANTQQRREWDWRTGHTVQSAVRRTFPSIHNLQGDVRVEGLGGEIGRGFYWEDTDRSETGIDAEELLDRFNKPARPSIVSSLNNWLDELNEFDTYTILDLAYQEHRLGCWAGPQHLGLPDTLDYVCPFLQRPVISAMHRLSPEIRRYDALQPRLVGETWPVLNEYPYNRFEGWRAYVNRAHSGASLVKAAAIHPGRAVSHLIDRLSN